MTTTQYGNLVTRNTNRPANIIPTICQIYLAVISVSSCGFDTMETGDVSSLLGCRIILFLLSMK